MIIQNSQMLSQDTKDLRFYQCSLLATDGPNTIGKINLSDISLKFDSQYTSKMILNPGARNQPILYGFLGKDITFLLIKVYYDKSNPYCLIEEDNYIEYYLADEPNLIRYIGELMILTGNSKQRIPQIYLNNPSLTNKLTIDVMMANLEQSDLIIDDVKNDLIFSNLYHRNILSNQIRINNYTGSTQFEIIDMYDNTQLVIPYNEIESIKIYEDKYRLTINTNSEQNIVLEFLSLFEMYQANSRINWVIENQNMEFLSKDYPSSDLTPPTIIENTGITSIYPVIRDINNNINITTTELIDYFIDQIYDDRDGEINKYDMEVNIFKENEIINLTGITEIGVYNISLSIIDIANNKSSVAYNIIINDVSPTIIFNNNINNIFTMNIPNNVQNTYSGMTKNDIIRYSVNYAYDSLNNIIPNSSIIITIDEVSGNTNINTILNSGVYNITYSITDSANNNITYLKQLTVSGSYILSANSIITIPFTTTNIPLIYTGSANTSATLIIDTISIIIGNVNNQFVFDLGGENEYTYTIINETNIFTINNNVYNIQFNGYGSLLFTITYVEQAPIINTITMYYDYTDINNNLIPENIVAYYNDSYNLTFDGVSSSTYEISLLNVSVNKTLNNNLFSLYLKNYVLNDYTYATLDEYYLRFNHSYYNDILSQISPFVYLNGETLKFIDSFNHDINIINSGLLLCGDFPKGEYNLEGYYYDLNNYYNILKIKLIIN